MQMREDKPESQQALIAAYGDGGFRVGETRIEGGLVLHPTGFDPLPNTDLAPAALDLLNAETLDFVIIGTGATLAPVSNVFLSALRSRGLRHDTMATGAAARTYNVMVIEGRRVAAIMLPAP